VDFKEQLIELSGKIQKFRGEIVNEESAKHAFVLPFINALGYDTGVPTEVFPEFSADFGTSIADKVDYAIQKDKKPVILFECKWHGNKPLEKKDEDQLRKYFAACTDTRFGIVTDGIQYKFFSDLEKSGVMDEKPFLEFDMSQSGKVPFDDLKIFSKSVFDPGNVIEKATELKYLRGLQRTIEGEFNSPSEEFIKLLASKVYPDGKKITKSILGTFTKLTKRALTQFRTDLINEFLDVARKEADRGGAGPEPKSKGVSEPVLSPTLEEQEAFYIVKGLVCQDIPQ